MQRPFFSALLFLSLGFGLTSQPVSAQSGFILFGPKSSDQVLNYYISNNRSGAQLINYTFYLKTQKVAVRSIQLIVPEVFDDSFDTNSLEIINNDGGTVFALDGAQFDKDTHTLTINIKEPIPAGVPIALKVRNATNPRAPGIHRIRARLLGTEPNAIFRFVGDWYLSLN